MPVPAITPPAYWSCLSLLSVKTHTCPRRRPAARASSIGPGSIQNSSRVGHTFALPTQPCHSLPNENPLSQLGVWMSRSMDTLEDCMGTLEEGNGPLWKMGRTHWILGRLEVSRYILPNPSSSWRALRQTLALGLRHLLPALPWPSLPSSRSRFALACIALRIRRASSENVLFWAPDTASLVLALGLIPLRPRHSARIRPCPHLRPSDI
jgi:hypothetical protein